MNTISTLTRQKILSCYGISRIRWYGKINQIQFLSRLYNLEQLPSTDTRFKTAKKDIEMHAVRSGDWGPEWVFNDFRFNIEGGTDENFINFLCLTLHPKVRENKQERKALLLIYNNQLSKHNLTIAKHTEYKMESLSIDDGGLKKSKG